MDECRAIKALTEKRIYVKVRSPEVAVYAPRLLENYRSPFSGQRGADNPLLATALTWTNNRPDLSP